MGNFNRDRRPGGGRDRGSRGGFGGGRDRGFGGDRRDRDNRSAEMHHAVCDGCGVDCEVPFRPTSGKPVYCNDCFKKNDSRPSRSSAGQDNSQVIEAINGLNAKLDVVLSLLQVKEVKTKKTEKDTEEKPVKAVKKVVKKKK